MKIAAIIEARMGSTRLPGKTLKLIAGTPLLERLLERVQRSKLLNTIVVATTIEPADDQIQACCDRLGIQSYRGSVDDVLDRVVKAAQSCAADIIVELHGDNPLLDPEIIDMAIQRYLVGDCDYVSTTLTNTFPSGLRVQVFSRQALEHIARNSNDPADREHVSLHFYEHPKQYRLAHVEAPKEISRPDLRFTVDTPEDFALVEKIYAALYPLNKNFGTRDVIEFINSSGINTINAHIKSKAVRP